MFDDFTSLIDGFRFIDLIDTALVSVAIYKMLEALRGTRALGVLTGMAVLFLLYLISNTLEMVAIQRILNHMWGNLSIIAVILFQQDIRRVLSRLGTQRLFHSPQELAEQGHLLEELIKTSVSLANKKMGALMVIEREADVTDYVEEGVEVDARVTKEMITSVFLPVSPLHDGAMIISQGRIKRVRCFLPLTLNPQVVKTLGTRHRAALGITEETDAVCIVISEEDGAISIVVEGKIHRDLDATTLRKKLTELLHQTSEWGRG